MLLCIEQALSALGSRAVQQQELQALLALLVRHCVRDGDFLLLLCITRDVNTSRMRHLAEILGNHIGQYLSETSSSFRRRFNVVPGALADCRDKPIFNVEEAAAEKSPHFKAMKYF